MSAPWRSALLWALLIEVLIVWPHPPDVPQAITFPGIDKVVHFCLFGVMAALLVRARPGTAKTVLAAVVITAAYGAFTEFEQSFIPSRSMELGDFLADATGATLGAVAFTLLARRRREFSR